MFEQGSDCLPAALRNYAASEEHSFEIHVLLYIVVVEQKSHIMNFNLSFSHGNKEVFSCRGIKLAVDWFLERGHKDVTVFVPAWRKEQSRPDALITGKLYSIFSVWFDAFQGMNTTAEMNKSSEMKE